uniref:Ankyrin repeat-containing protein n=1 Tax=viral metagenome TaxID=1070528 RepID=A0A6C0I718_9ZZZZ
MSEFITSISSTLELEDYSVDLLPAFITESGHFKTWRDLFPEETVFPFLKSKMVDTLELHSLEDFKKLIEADAMFHFGPDVQKQILKNMYNFWLDNSESSQLEMPIKDFSHFGNQVKALFSDSESILPVRCFQSNYVELFDYLLERDGLHRLDSGRFPDYTLPYYGVTNNHIEITRRGLEAGLSVSKDVLDAAIKQKNLEMFNLLREHKVKFTAKTLEMAAKLGLPEMYEYFLRCAINNDMFKNYVFKTIHNKANLEYLLLRSGTDMTSINGTELLEECISETCGAEIVQMVNAYFTKPDDTKTLLETMCQFRPGSRHIKKQVVYNDDLELFVYLQSNGFLINEHLIDYAIENKTRKLTPGFLKRQLALQQIKELEKGLEKEKE